MPPSTRRPCASLVAAYRDLVPERTGQPFPDDPWVQLRGAVEAVFRSWNTARAVAYRREFRIPDDLGTAVTVQAMVFGNLGDDCATGVAFTRDPATGERRLVGEYLPNAQGEDVVAGIRTPRPARRHGRRSAPGRGVRRPADGRGAAGGALQRRPGPGVHDRAGPALDAPDAGGQAHRPRRRPHRRRDGRRGTDRPRHRGPARPARPTEPTAPSDDRPGRRPGGADRRAARLPGRRQRPGRLRPRRGAAAARERPAGHPRPPRDLAGGLPRHGGRPRHRDRPRRHHLARGGGRAGDGQAVRDRGRGARDQRGGRAPHGRRRPSCGATTG